jgi:hypothetical protein
MLKSYSAPWRKGMAASTAFEFCVYLNFLVFNHPAGSAGCSAAMPAPARLAAIGTVPRIVSERGGNWRGR